MGKLTELSPNTLWRNFELLCGIPRPSKHEDKVRSFVLEYARNLSLDCFMDNVGNVIVRKPATEGYENRKTVVLQAHLDMVPQKNADTAHDFKNDPIKAYIDGDWVTAEGTTLGADNGIGVAAALAVLEATDLKHPAIEALFTADEETGMTGAFGLKPNVLKGDILLNLDSEDEGELYIGCAGGIDFTAQFEYNAKKLKADFHGYKLSVKGLKGGHSGLDINLGRGNANKIMNRILWRLSEDFGVRLGKLTGGSLRNAIPRESFAEIAIPTLNLEKSIELVSELELEIKNELGAVEPDFSVVLTPTELCDTYVDKSTANRLYKSIYAAPNGVMRMSSAMEGLTETSLNLAIITVKKGVIKIKFLLRSSVDSAKQDLVRMLTSLFELAGAEIEVSGSYPGWKPNPNSEILELMKGIYQNNWGRIPEVKAIHAGLECGLLGGVYPNWDMISFGPTIRYPHSPDEKVNIASVEKFWAFLVSTLENIPIKN